MIAYPENAVQTSARIAGLEEALEMAEARFAGVVEISADAVISINHAQEITFFNAGAERIFGYSADEAIGSPLELLIPGRFRLDHSALVERFGAGESTARKMGSRREIFGRRKNGEEFPAEASISKFGTGEAVTYNAVLRDVSERKRREDGQTFLAHAGRLLSETSLDHDTTLATLARLAVPALADCCTVDSVGDDGSFSRIGVAHAQPEDEALLRARARYDLDTSSAEPSSIVQVLRGSGAVLTAHVQRDTLDDAAPHSTICVPMISSGRVLGAISLSLVRSPRSYTEVDLALATELAARAAQAVDNAGLLHAATEATRARDDVLGIVAHDLRNPLSTVLLASQILLEDPTGKGHAREAELLTMIQTSASQMQRMIQDLLDVKQVETGRLVVTPTPQSIAAIVTSAVELLRPITAASSVELASEVPTELPLVLADAARIQQVLSNLVGNAVKFTPPGGRVAIRVEAESASEARISVRDTGSGITPDQLPHVFGRFWQGHRTDRRGVGLGLAIVKGIVDAHHGRVWVESVVGKGSTFIFTLPFASIDAASLVPPRMDTHHEGNGEARSAEKSKANSLI